MKKVGENSGVGVEEVGEVSFNGVVRTTSTQHTHNKNTMTTQDTPKAMKPAIRFDAADAALMHVAPAPKERRTSLEGINLDTDANQMLVTDSRLLLRKNKELCGIEIPERYQENQRTSHQITVRLPKIGARETRLVRDFDELEYGFEVVDAQFPDCKHIRPDFRNPAQIQLGVQALEKLIKVAKAHGAEAITVGMDLEGIHDNHKCLKPFAIAITHELTGLLMPCRNPTTAWTREVILTPEAKAKIVKAN